MQEFKKKIHGSGTTTLIISNEEMNDIMKIVQALEDSNILLKGVTKTIKNKTKEQKGGVFTLGASFLENLLAGKGNVRAGSGNKKGKGIARAGYGYLHPLFCKKNRIFNAALSFNKLGNTKVLSE